MDACHTAVRFPVDGWSAALGTVRRLLSLVWNQENAEGGVLDAGSVQEVTNRFVGLPLERQAEIKWHLDMILSGVLQDHLDSVDARRVAVERMAGDRVDRAWKFFEPDPVEPRVVEPTASLIRGVAWTKVWLGGGFAVLGLLGALDGDNPVLAVLGLLMIAGGGFLCVHHGAERRFLDNLRARPDLAHAWLYHSSGHSAQTDFVQGIHQRVDARFREARPPDVTGDWDEETRGLREYWKDRLVTLYEKANVGPEAVNWLIRWHAGRTAASWHDGGWFDRRDRLVPSNTTNVLFGLGVGGFVLGLVFLTASGNAGSVYLIGVGGGFALVGASEIVATRRHDQIVNADNKRLAGEEAHAYLQMVMMLKDRPSDGEMAEWLARDVLYLKSAALRRCGLSNRDLVAHVVLTDGNSTSMRARVLHGPVRYSEYVVMVFLMTRSGVREVEVDLDFLRGDVHDERRLSFRYDALATARVEEAGVRFAHDGRYVVDANNAAPGYDGGRVVRNRVFALSLVNGTEITAVVENFAGIADPGEDSSRLLRMALDNSGIAGALHVLEAVAAEGREWITREQARRERRSVEWQDDHRDPGLIGPELPNLFSTVDDDDGPDRT
jgi:hypothetical protein